MKLDLQFFGGRGASSSGGGRNGGSNGDEGGYTGTDGNVIIHKEVLPYGKTSYYMTGQRNVSGGKDRVARVFKTQEDAVKWAKEMNLTYTSI